MTPWMQFRLWVRDATAAERRITYAVIAVVVAVLGASIVMRPGSSSKVGTAAARNGRAGPAAAASRSTGTSGAAAASPSQGTTGAISGAPGTSGGVPTAGGGGGGATISAGAADEPLTASDRGVSESEITLGFMLQNTAGLNSAGFSTGQRRDGEQYIQALTDSVNNAGGIAGRTIKPYIRFTDPTSTADAAAACQAMVSDAKVFGIVDVASIVDTGGQDCITNKGDTPYVHSVLWSRDWQARSRGNEVSYQAAIDRISVTWARDLRDSGWLQPGATVGILGDKCPATQPTIENILEPELEAAGAGKVVIGEHDCDIAAVASQPPNIVTQFRLAGVTNVLIVSNFVSGQVFVSAAKGQGYKPKYSISDWFLMSADATTKNYDPDEFDGAIGITSLGESLPASGKEPYPGLDRCSKIATDAGLPPIDWSSSSSELLSLCDNFFLFIDALSAAGRNPTRASWRDAVTQLPPRTSVMFGPSAFGPDKLSGSDQVHTIEWHRDCTCWKSISDFRPAAA